MADEQLVLAALEILNEPELDLWDGRDQLDVVQRIIELTRRHDAGATIMELPLPPGYQVMPHGVNYTHPMRINL